MIYKIKNLSIWILVLVMGVVSCTKDTASTSDTPIALVAKKTRGPIENAKEINPEIEISQTDALCDEKLEDPLGGYFTTDFFWLTIKEFYQQVFNLPNGKSLVDLMNTGDLNGTAFFNVVSQLGYLPNYAKVSVKNPTQFKNGMIQYSMELENSCANFLQFQYDVLHNGQFKTIFISFHIGNEKMVDLIKKLFLNSGLNISSVDMFLCGLSTGAANPQEIWNMALKVIPFIITAYNLPLDGAKLTYSRMRLCDLNGFSTNGMPLIKCDDDKDVNVDFAVFGCAPIMYGVSPNGE
jgi:hypothetical protein